MYIDLTAISILIGIIFMIALIKSGEWFLLFMILGFVLFIGLMAWVGQYFGAEYIAISIIILFVVLMIIKDQQDKKKNNV